MRQYDPQRWDSVPITYQTVFNGYTTLDFMDIKLSIHVHDALEREFNIDIDDKKILLGTIEDCVKFVLEEHSAL